MVLGFGCTCSGHYGLPCVGKPAETGIKTMLVTPFMSCSARLPIYVLFASIFFGKYNAMLVAYSMYLIGIVVAIAGARL